jgi:predicted HAD superfamily Cof-like phosphohydrolase
MTKVFTDVQVFMAAAGQTVNKDNEDQALLYRRLINEEYNEFIAAVQHNDDVETVDACFDTMWVVIGYMLSRGWDLEGIWEEGAKSNLAKIDPTTGTVIKRADGKVLKPEGWKKPDFSRFAKSST